MTGGSPMTKRKPQEKMELAGDHRKTTPEFYRIFVATSEYQRMQESWTSGCGWMWLVAGLPDAFPKKRRSTCLKSGIWQTFGTRG